MFLATTSLDSSSFVVLRVLMVDFTYFQVHLLKCKQSLDISQRVHICTCVFLKQLNSLLVNKRIKELSDIRLLGWKLMAFKSLKSSKLNLWITLIYLESCNLRFYSASHVMIRPMLQIELIFQANHFIIDRFHFSFKMFNFPRLPFREISSRTIFQPLFIGLWE